MRTGSARRVAEVLTAFTLVVVRAAAAAELPPGGFAGLEEAGAVIGTIRVEPRNIFDLANRGEDLALYRFLNRVHILSRPEVVARFLLFASGEKVSVQKIEETERLLRSQRVFHDVQIRPTRYENGVVDIEVVTRDTWSLDLTGSFSRAGGENKGKFGIRERNLLGTGVYVGFGRSSDADRAGNEVELGYHQAFDGWTHLHYTRGEFSDGKRTLVEVDRPFYSFDARWSARTTWSDEDRIDPIYNAGVIASEHRHRAKSLDVVGGWSPGLVDGWTQRFSAGVLGRDDAYAAQPGRVATIPLPIDHKVRGPLARYELLQDHFLRVTNYNRIARPEFLALGFAGYVQVARALRAWGSTQSEWLYAAGFSDGFTSAGGNHVLGRMAIERRIGSTASPLTQAGGAVQLYVPWGRRALFYSSLAADHVDGGGIADQLEVGGREGLRGYPLRYQAGDNRVVASVEQRVYSDWYPFRIARVGAAAFFDVGRAWGGPNRNTVNGGWLSDVGIGLRVAIDRAAFDNVLHVDLAVPLQRAPGVKGVQFLVKTEVSF